MNRAFAGPTQKDMAAMCKAQGLVFDRETKQCRAALPKGRKSGLEAAYARGSLFFGKNRFGVNRPASHQRAGIVYSSPASTLGSKNVYGIIGPVQGKITGPASFLADTSVVSPAMMKELGVSVPKTPVSTNKRSAPAKFGTAGKRKVLYMM